MVRALARGAALALVVLRTSVALGAGPILVNGAGQPVVWAVNPVPFNPDRGSLGALNNTEAISHVTADAAVWGTVTTSAVSLSNAGLLPVDVTVANYMTFLNGCGDGLNPVIFDKDGTITDDLIGVGASNNVIGFAAIACGTYVPPVATEGLAVLNGRFLDGVSTSSNRELTPAQFDAVMIHELGHYLGLDHSQVGLAEAFDGAPANDDAIATMFPILVNGDAMASLHLDDRVAISTLYPTASFATDFGTITGTIFLGDGVSSFQGANVVARRLGDPTIAAVSNVSGARYFPFNFGGPPPVELRGLFEIPGLPPGSYTIEVETVYPNFRGGSSVGPLEVPAGLPGQPEFWNGANEAGTDPPDDVTESVPIAVVAGATVSAIDVVLNQGPVPANDECAAATEIAATPFSDTLDTTGALHGAFDPLQSCTFPIPSQNERSVWYHYTAPADGIVSADTIGSNYDTLLSVSSGACGASTERACSDDVSGGRQSAVQFPVTAGTSYIFEITSYEAAGGMLHFAVDWRPPVTSCPTSPATGCRVPALVGKSSLRLNGSPDPAKRQLQWKWNKGAATSLDDFGDPTTAAGMSYFLCVYDDTDALLTSASIPAGGVCRGRECWIPRPNGFKYRDADATPAGVKSLDLGSGTIGKARINLKAAGSLYASPALPVVAPPVTVQLINRDGTCWQAAYSAVQRNDLTQFKAHD